MNKKILILASDFPPDTGGVQNFTYNIAKHIEKYKPIVIAPYSAKETAKEEFPVIRTENPIFFKKEYLFRAFIKGIKIIRTQKIDIILCAHPLMGILGLLFKFLFKNEYAVLVHGRELRGKKLKFFLKGIFHFSKKIFANSEWTKEEVKKIGVKSSKIIKIMPGVEKKTIEKVNKEEIKETFGIKDKKVLLTVGRLSDLHKGQDKVISALPYVIREIPDCVYLIVGEGSYREFLEKKANKMCLKEHIFFLGRISEQELLKIYSITDLFVMPCREIKKTGAVEGFGIVFLEAGLFSIPVIGGKTGGVSDAIENGKTGFLVNPFNEKEIAEKIIFLLKNSQIREKMGKYARERVLKKFTWDKIIKEMEKYI